MASESYGLLRCQKCFFRSMGSPRGGIEATDVEEASKSFFSESLPCAVARGRAFPRVRTVAMVSSFLLLSYQMMQRRQDWPLLWIDTSSTRYHHQRRPSLYPSPGPGNIDCYTTGIITTFTGTWHGEYSLQNYVWRYWIIGTGEKADRCILVCTLPTIVGASEPPRLGLAPHSTLMATSTMSRSSGLPVLTAPSTNSRDGRRHFRRRTGPRSGPLVSRTRSATDKNVAISWAKLVENKTKPSV